MNVKKYILLIVGLATIGSLALAIPVFAQTGPTGQGGGRFGFGRGMGGGQAPAVVGTVSAISGDTITVNGRHGFGSNSAATATYTVDATNATVTKAGQTSSVSAIAVGDTIMVQGTVSGTNVTATTIRDGVGMGFGQRGGMGIGGTVSAINGTTLTVTRSKGYPAMPNGGTASTYTVDASNATVTKNGTASSVSAIAVGDTVRIQGTVSDTSVTAKTIMDGVGQGQMQIQGNGQPVVGGKVTAINGNTITITNNSNVTYTVDATNAKFVVPGVTSPTISNIAVGDQVEVQTQGTITQETANSANVTAYSVLDQKGMPNGNQNNAGNKPKPQSGFGGMMVGIGNFFKKLFGF